MLEPILSICIPTYNRANWLRSSLWNWLPQVNQTNGLVELIVCDNSSLDNTKQVIEEAYAWGDFQYHCNDQNIGAIRNIYKLVKDLAKGKFVWVVGDDDLPNVNALQSVINILKDYSEVNYVYVNYSYWNPSKEQQNQQLLESKNLDFSQILSLDLETRFVNRLAEIIPLDFNCFTPIYCSIMRKQDAYNAFQLGIQGNAFSSLETVVPHAVYIVNNLLDKSCWYIGTPCILASCDVSWSEFMVTYTVDFVPSLYKMIEKKIGSKSYTDLHRRRLLDYLSYLVNEFLLSDIQIKKKLHIKFKHYANYPIFRVIWNDIKYFKFKLGLGNKIRHLNKLFLSKRI